MSDKRLRILVLSDGFSQPAYKPRLRILCEWLQQQGHHVHVLCEKADELSFAHNYPIDEIALYKGGMADWTVKNIGTMLFNWKERAFQRAVEKRIKGNTYDFIFCTSFHTFPLRSANRIGAKLHIPVVLDIRDMTEQAPANRFLYLSHHASWLRPFAELYLAQNLRRRNKELARATAVTTVSPWHNDLIRRLTGQTHVTTIYNGYDAQCFKPRDTPSTRFSIVYTGKVFPSPQQEPGLLFAALKQLNISPKQLSVDWYIDATSEALIRQQAKEANVEAWMNYHGQIPQSEIVTKLHEASVCLVLTSRANDTNGHGKMTTKFFEALGVEKPVLCVESDEECLASVMRNTHAGLSATNAQEVADFLQAKYTEWQQKGFTRQAVDLQQKALFSRQAQAMQWIQIFKEIAE